MKLSKMMKFSRLGAGVLVTFALLPSPGHTQEKVSPFAVLPTAARKQNAGDFVLAASKAASPIYLDANDYPVVQIAAEALADDIQRVTTARPDVLTTAPAAGETAVLIGTVGKSRLIDGLVAAKKLDVSGIPGQWERFVIATVENPLPGVRQALVIAGSDRRGTAFGAFSVSESIGVSPWVWWADVTPERRDTVVIPRTRFVSKAPSVKYRGIFINDEDWGLLPWSKKFEPEVGSIGPKTYARVGELLLRLKANYLWPAMHEATRAFNQIPENKVVMDRYAIVMGASHAEPMLFNNATEWKYPHDYWNYETHADLIKSVWEKRVQENGRYENSYTLGIRGIHDRPMQGGGTLQDGVRRLERVIADQRALLAKYVNPDLEQVAQVFVPYKEVLPYYQAGMKVPEDVTLVWVDDNFGFIRQLSDPAEQKRSGHAGVYYHFSYLGPPQEYLWIGSTSPALTAYEMGKAYAYGADRLWVFNVGDIKPIEKEMEFGLRLAYDIDRYPADKAMGFLGDFAAQNFGTPYAAETAAVLTEYYRLTAQAKPEHSDRTQFFSRAEQNQRLAAYAALLRRAESLYAGMPAARKDVFFELVLYPVKGAALMNAKHTYAARGDEKSAIEAYEGMQQITLHYNKESAGGKWDGVIRANIRNQRVFARPAAVSPIATAAPLVQLEPKNAELAGSMTLVNNTLVAAATGASPPELPSGSGNAARFRFQSPRARPVSLYFLAQTVDDKHDSWHVSLNGRKVVCNDQVTGDEADWIKVMDADLVPGGNSLVIEPRESGTVIHRVALLEAGKAPAQSKRDPDVILAAADYTQIENTAASRWQKIEGLGIERSAMTLLPYQSQSIGDPAKAPAITYSFPSTRAGATIETRFLPTHRVNEGMGLRYAISVDGGPAEIGDLNSAEWSGSWSRNVLRGYSKGTTTHALKAGSRHTITIRLLDPGMVLSQIRVFGA